MLHDVAVILGTIGSTLLAIFGLFKLFFSKWLDTRFRRQIEQFKHEQQRELEQLRLKINTLFDRTVKLHQREFEVLPDAWAKLTDSFHQTSTLISSFQSFPDLDAMGELQLEEFLKNSPIADWQKEDIRNAGKKTDRYMDAIRWYRIGAARERQRECNTCLRKLGIFLPSDLKDGFDHLATMIFEALFEFEFTQGHRDLGPARREKAERLGKEGAALLKELEASIHRRFWDDQVTSESA